MGAVTYPTLEHVAMQARPYPTHLLEGCETGLCLFAAAFLGHNDAVHFAEAGIEDVWCVDINGERLQEMKALYPSSWNFVEADAFEWADVAYDCDEKFDAVSVDTFTGEAMLRSFDWLSVWCSIARKVVTVTWQEGHEVPFPQGWRGELHHRAADIYWLVLTRA